MSDPDPLDDLPPVDPDHATKCPARHPHEYVNVSNSGEPIWRCRFCSAEKPKLSLKKPVDHRELLRKYMWSTDRRLKWRAAEKGLAMTFTAEEHAELARLASEEQP